MENERKRILELVKQGIISTEEALTLLENISKKEGKTAAKENIRRSAAPREEEQSKKKQKKNHHTITVKVGTIKETLIHLQKVVKDAQNRLQKIMKETKKRGGENSLKIVKTPCAIWLMIYPKRVKKSVLS